MEHHTGEVFLNGEKISLQSPAHAIKAGVVLAPEDRTEEGLILGMNVAENISLADQS